MIDVGSGDAPAFHHCARLMPLPHLASLARPPSLHSARSRHRFNVQLTIQACTNSLICTLNRLYHCPSTLTSHPPSQPDNLHCTRCQPSLTTSAAQHRVLDQLRDRCARFVLKARTWSAPTGSTDRDITTQQPALNLLFSAAHAPSNRIMAAHTPPLPSVSTPSPASSDTTSQPAAPSDSLRPALEADLLQFFSSQSFSSAATAVVPLIAARVALPSDLNIIPMQRVLPPDIAAQYSEAAASALLRPAHLLLALQQDPATRCRPGRVAGSRTEYVKLIGRMYTQRMSAFTACPKAVNGVFTVGKDADADRLIVDAQPANQYFVDSPHVSLPGPSHLVQLHVPHGQTMYVGKSDLSNYYHHLGLPAWIQPYLALPPLTAAELASIGAPTDCAYPMCTTMPMGWSHAVYIGQAVHEHLVYSSGAIEPQDNLLRLASPLVTHDRAQHGIVIDDFFLFSLNRELAQAALDRVLAAYRAAGFIVKQSKVVEPTSDPVKVIGFDIDGASSRVSLPADSSLSLLRATLSLLRRPTVSGTLLSHLVGRWTWVMMLRRPTLAVLQHVYRYCNVARGRPFTLWPSVRRELVHLLHLLPLLEAQLDEPFFHRALASDASSLAAGVVSTALTPELHTTLWPLCSTRHHALQQARLNNEAVRALLAEPSPLDTAATAADRHSMGCFDSAYESVAAAPWRTIVSSAWRGAEHINVLELRAALLAAHHALSYPSSHHRRVYLLVDSTVAFFSMWKGRSSSPPLLLVLRKLAALSLAGSITLLPGWLPSAANPADAPSRLLPSACPLGRLAA